jgi:hypothetical protein
MRPAAPTITPASVPMPSVALEVVPQDPPSEEAPGSGLLVRLAQALDAHRISYCQWKGHWSAHRWATGHGDVDLLVDHDGITAFREIAGRLGFKLATPPGERQIAGVESYFGHDPAVPRLLHLHVHYRLILGDYWKTAYRIPLERAILDTAVPGSVFRVPAPTYQFLLLVLRLILRQRGRPLLWTRTRWLSGVQIQLGYLEANSDREELATVLKRHLPSIDIAFFERCVRSLQGALGPVERAGLPRQLHLRLRSHARAPGVTALISAGVEKALPRAVTRRLLYDCMCLAGGGTAVALIGGDGAGKSTCARELGTWLAPNFATMRAHLGNPPRSLLTIAVGGMLKAEQALYRLWRRESPGGSHLELLRHLCTARDRYRLYEKVQRFTARGGIAICERYPVPQNRVLVGPSIPALLPVHPGPFARLLRNAEASCYDRILPPDALFVLRLDPELAVRRKPEEPADYVRERGRVVWNTDWSSTTARVIDVSPPLSEVLRELKSLVWSVL